MIDILSNIQALAQKTMLTPLEGLEPSNSNLLIQRTTPYPLYKHFHLLETRGSTEIFVDAGYQTRHSM